MLSEMVPPPLRAVLANDDGRDNSRELPLIRELVPSPSNVELSPRIWIEDVREFVPSYVPSS